ncbi:MAG: HAD family hydrolase [Bacilli bacterium]|nr:HAD family hydrolase [Bacilli bacterium]
MKKRYIFDLDGTLMRGGFSGTTDQYLLDRLGEDVRPVLGNMKEYLGRYERYYRRYTDEDLSRFLSLSTNLSFTPEMIREWDELVTAVPNTLEEGVFETLETLKERDKDLVVLTNWFTESQRKRLENEGLLPYFSAVYGGDISTKPHKEAYWIASGEFAPDECVFIGDNVDFDYIGPKSCGFDSILYDKNDVHHKSIVKVKRLNEITKMYER